MDQPESQQPVEALARLASRVDARRTLVGWFRGDRLVLSHQWARPFSPVFRPEPDGTPTDLIPNWSRLTRGGDVVRIDDRERLGPDWTSERMWLAMNTIVAALCVPVVDDDGTVAGFVLADDERARSWSDHDIAVLEDAAQHLRHSPDRPTTEALDWPNTSVEDLPLALAAIDADGSWVYANGRMRDLARRPGSGSSTLTADRSFLADVSESDMERLRTVLRPVVEGRQATTAGVIDVWGRPTEARFLRVPPSGRVRALVMATPTGPSGPIDDIDVVAALSAGWVHVHYQPLLDLSDRVIGAEALVRIEHPLLGAIAPDTFVSAAERSGTVPALDRFVIDQAFNDHARLRDERSWLEISVNLSAETVLDGIADHLEASAGRHRVPYDQIQVEVTETRSLGGHRSRSELTSIGELGITVALDDFGTGFTSFDNLTALPIDAVKLDRSVIAGTSASRGAVVARGVAELASNLGLAVIAEGVENDAERQMVGDLGCAAWQGYRFSGAVPADEFAALLARHGG